MKKKKYKIDSLEKLLNVANKENIERLSIDFLLWLNHHVQVMDKVRTEHPELKSKSNSEIAECSFIWTDDGKPGITSVVLSDSATGEEVVVKPKKK